MDCAPVHSYNQIEQAHGVLLPVERSFVTENLAGLAPGLQDPSHDVLRSEPRPLDVLFKSASVAVIGASERPGSVGRTIVSNPSVSAFKGQVKKS